MRIRYWSSDVCSSDLTLKAAVQIQALAILCAIISVLLLNDILPSNDAHLWLVLCSFAVVGAAGFFHAPLAAGNFVMIVLAGTIITKSEFDWPAFALVIITATATYGIARLQFASFRQSIRKARETEERARTAQAVLRSFEESGNNWLWEKIGRAHV